MTCDDLSENYEDGNATEQQEAFFWSHMHTRMQRDIDFEEIEIFSCKGIIYEWIKNKKLKIKLRVDQYRKFFWMAQEKKKKINY